MKIHQGPSINLFNLLWYDYSFSENNFIKTDTPPKKNPFSFLAKFHSCLGFFLFVLFGVLFCSFFSLTLSTDFHHLNTFLLCEMKHFPRSMEQKKRSNAKFFLLWDILEGWISTSWSASCRHMREVLKREMFEWQSLKQTLEKMLDGEVNYFHFCALSMLVFLLTFSVNTNNNCLTRFLEAWLAIDEV